MSLYFPTVQNLGQEDFPIGLPSREDRFPLAAGMIGLVGRRIFQLKVGYPAEEPALSMDMKVLCQRIWGCFEEIQKNLFGNHLIQIEANTPLTNKLITDLFPRGANRDNIRQELIKCSFFILPFHQSALVYQASLEHEKRSYYYLGISALMDLIENKPKIARDDHKEQPLTPDLTFYRAKAYFSIGVMGTVQNPIYMCDLFRAYQEKLSDQESYDFGGCLDNFTLAGNWFFTHKPLPYHLTDIDIEGGFRKYFIRCSIRDIEDHLGFSFTEASREVLMKGLYDNGSINEKFRSDALFYSSNSEMLDRDLVEPDIGTSSFNHFIQTLQIFFFFKKKYGVTPEISPSLFDIIYFRDRSFSLNRLDGFAERSMIDPRADLDPDFLGSFSRTMGLVKIVTKQEVNFAAMEEADQTQVWRLFNLFQEINSEYQTQWLELFEIISKVDTVAVSLKMVYRFLDKNKDYHFIVAGDDANGGILLANSITQIAVTEKGKGWEKLYFDPPIELTNDLVLRMVQMPEKIAAFTTKIERYEFDQPTKISMIRQFVLSPQRVNAVLDFCEKSAKELDISMIDAPLLNDIFSSSFQVSLSQPKDQQLALTYVKNLHRKYAFSAHQRFLLFFEFLRTVSQNQTSLIEQVCRIASKLEALSPFFSEKLAFFLFKYLPMDFTELNALIIAHHRWMVDNRLSLFIMKTADIGMIEEQIEKAIAGLLKACNDKGSQGDVFAATLRKVLQLAFFVPWQVVTDHLRISDLTEDGVVMASSHLETNRGMFHLFSPITQSGAYLNWFILGGYPHLFISFSSLKTPSARSQFEKLEINFSEIDAPLRKKVCMLIHLMGQPIVTEKPDQDSLPFFDGDEYQDGNLLHAFELIPGFIANVASVFGIDLNPHDSLDVQYEQLEDYRNTISPVWEFLLRVKKACRLRYFEPPESELIPPLGFVKGALKQAAEGMIYPTKQGASLVSEELLELYQPHFFTSEITQTLKERCHKLFQTPLEKEALNFSIHITSTGADSEELPIDIQIQTAGSLVGFDIDHLDDHKEWDGRAPDKEESEQSFYVTLSVHNSTLSVPLRYIPEVFEDDELFAALLERHLLFLKASCYKNRQQDQSLEDSSPDLSAEY